MSKPPAMPRRQLLQSLAALFALPRATPADGPGTADDDEADLIDLPVSAIFDLGQHWRITFDGDAFSAEPVARWEVPEIAAAEQPTPVITEQERLRSAKFPIMLRRYWRPEEVDRCGLCPRCNAGAVGRHPRHPDLVACVRFPLERLSDEDAPLHRTSWEEFRSAGRTGDGG